MKTKAEQLLKFLNNYFEKYRMDDQTVLDWREEHIFDNAKIESNITGEKSNAEFALVFDDGMLYDMFYLLEKESKIALWAKDNGLFMEQYNSWNALFYKE